MNLNKLFELQRKLDEHIVKEKGLEGQDLLPKKILALQVELGELCNCWRGFKYWSNDQEPRIKDYKQTKCKWCNGSGDDGTGVCPDCKCEGYVYKEYNPLLEEYVDCLHFILSIGNEVEMNGEMEIRAVNKFDDERINDEIIAFQQIFGNISNIYWGLHYNNTFTWYDYIGLFGAFIKLGEFFGFTWEQIEKAYLQKNEVNHQRQEDGY